MHVPKLAFDTYLALSLVLATPWTYRIFSPLMYDKPVKSTQGTFVSALLLIHTLFLLYQLLVAQPINIFDALGLTATAPPEYLKNRLAEAYGGAENVPSQLGVVVKRLGLIDMRSYYVRFGHEVLTNCDFCQSFDDFALFALPGTLLEYVREIALVGFLTLPNTKDAYLRPLALGALMAAFLTENYWTLTTQVLIPAPNSERQVFMWHDYIIQLRHLLFLILPIFVSVFSSLGLHRIPFLGNFIPAPPSPQQPQDVNNAPPGMQLNPAISQAPLSDLLGMMSQTLNHLIPTLHLLKYSHAAVMRSGTSTKEGEETTPLERATQWWLQEKREGDVVRQDADIRNILKVSGLSIEPGTPGTGGEPPVPDGPLLDSAKKAVAMFAAEGSKPSQFWVYNQQGDTAS